MNDLLIGRRRELSQLQRALADALHGRGQIVVLSGEPGIGKTRLAQEIASVANTRKVRALVGRCIEGAVSPPYWPWAQMVRSFIEHCTTQRRRRVLANLAPNLGAVVPELQKPSRVRRVASNPDAERFRVLDAMSTFLQRACRRTGLLLILEDLQWADRSSLLLLEVIAQQLHATPVLLVATCRDGHMSQPLARTFGELGRMGARRIVLQGISEQDTARLIRRVRGRPLADEIVRAVHARSNGNPFFVTEIARLPAGHPSAVPENVRDAILQRLAVLSNAARQLLEIASAVGREFSFPVVAAVMRDRDNGEASRGLEEAVSALMIQPSSTRREDWYEFTHELIRDTIYANAPPNRRACWHAAIVHAIEQLHGARLREYAAELAQHSQNAESVVGAATVVKYSRMAGEEKLAAHAFDDALPHFERAWQTRNSATIDAAAAAILLGLGCAEAATAVRWNRQQGWANVRRAIDFFLQTGDVDRAVAAAAHPAIAAEGASDVAHVIERILAHVATESVQEGWLRSRLGASLYFETGEYQRARTAFDRALKIAMLHRDRPLELRTLAYESSVDHFDLRWNDLLPKTLRALRLAQQIDDLHSETYVRYRTAFVLMNTGRVDEARLAAEANLAAAERLRDHGLLADALYVASTLAQLTGDWSDARRHCDRGLTLSALHLPLLHGRVLLEYETGEEERGGAFLQRLLDSDRNSGPYPLAAVFTAITLAQVVARSRIAMDAGAAHIAIRSVLARGTSIPNAVFTVRLARALLAIRDARSADCEAELEFLSRFDAIVPTQWCTATARVLGLLAQAAGQPRAARARFDAALTFCRRSGFRPELAWTCYDYAGLLLDDGSREDRRKAASLLDEAERIALELGMRPLMRHAAAFRERARLKLERKPAGLTNREYEVLRLLAMGKSNKEIAGTLFISVNTVAVHVAKILTKTSASNRTEATAFATRHHLL